MIATPLWRRFHIRLTLVYASAVFAILTALAVMSYRRGVHMEMDAVRDKLRAMAMLVARGVDATAVPALRSEADRDLPVHQQLVKRFAEVGGEEPDVSSIYILHKTEKPEILAFSVDWVRPGMPDAAAIGEAYDAHDTPKMLEAFTAPSVERELSEDPKWGDSISGYAPIRDATGQAVGIVGVDILAPRVAAIKRQILVATAVGFVLAALVATLAGLFVARAVRRPIERIVDASGEIADGRLGARVALVRGDEFGVMGQRFDDMAVKLEEREHIRQVFGRYVSEDVARKVLSSPDASRLGGEEREVTILFNDLRGYSTVTESLPPSETIGLLNEYMGGMGSIIDAHQGCVLEFIGDAIVAVFNAPADVADHPAQAVRCARAMVERLAELNLAWEKTGLAKLWQARGMAKLGARIGIHTGRVVAGTMGTSTRVKYGVIGDTVNVAARVESLNKDLGTQILLTHETWQRLPADLVALAQPHGEQAVKGRKQTVTVYSL